MKRHILIILLSAFLALPATGQDADPDTTGWERELLGKLSLTQAGFHNWADGGVSSLAASSGIDGTAKRVSGALSQRYELRAGFGFVQQDTLAVRKAEDFIVAKAVYQYAGEGFFSSLNPTLAITARSQFAEGFDYDRKKALPDGSPPKVSDFLSPGTFTQTLGLGLNPAEWATLRFGLSSKQTVVLIERLRTLYSMELDETVRAEIGVEFVAEVDRQLAENIHYKSSFGMFKAFSKADPDLIWENLLTLKVNSWLTTNVEWAMLLDQDRSDALQMREVLSVGITYRFI